VAEFSAAAQRAIEREHELLSLYPGELGHAGMRRLMAERESQREGVPVSPDGISLTNGSMQGVTLVAEALTQGRGDVVIAEEFTYPGTLSTYRDLGLRTIGLPIDEHGMSAEALERALTELERAGTQARFIYTEATYQNPTGTVMPRARRREILDLAKRFDTVLVEDNCYGDVHYDGEKPPAFYAIEEWDKHVYLCSLSKILAPGVRLGYLMASPALFRRILNRRHDAGSNTLAAAIVAEYLCTAGIWRHCDEQNAVLAAKRDLLVGMLGQELGDLCRWSNPAGGLFLWLRYPDDVDRERLQALADERGFRFARGRSFQVDNEDVPYLRLAFGHVPDAVIREGIPVLARCIREARTSNEAARPESLYR